VYLFII